MGFNEVAKLLLKHGAIIDTRTILDFNSPNGYTPLHIACERGYCDVVKSLLNFGAEINIKDGEGYTPLDRARMSNREEVKKYLKRKGGKHSRKYLGTQKRSG